MNRKFSGDDRAVSITVTHVLTIGITAILISGLLIGAGGLLETERERSTEQSLETIGERLSNELSQAERLGNGTTITATHPRTVTNSQYTVELLEAADCDAPLLDGSTNCLRLTSSDEDVEVFVPATVEPGDERSASGGTIEITNDEGIIEIEGRN